jgi:hypothetical protein
MIVLVALLTVVAGLAQYLASTPADLTASALTAVAGVAVAFAIVYRSRAGRTAATAAVLILINLVLALRAFITPR